MTTPRLHIGDKNYSSWSMRPWLALRAGGIAFEEVQHQLPEMGGKPSFGAVSPNAKVPALDLGDGVVIAESLAICEWAAEQQPTRKAHAALHEVQPHHQGDARQERVAMGGGASCSSSRHVASHKRTDYRIDGSEDASSGEAT